MNDLVNASPVPRAEALALLGMVTGRSREQLIADSGPALTREAIAAFDGLITRRVAGEPMAYLSGRREFFGRSFGVSPAVLIPRPETELLIDLAIGWLHELASVDATISPSVLELGTGAGAIAITLALECRAARIVATDLSPAALEVASRNAVEHGAALQLAQGDWFDALDHQDRRCFDLIVSNPPYIAVDDPHLAQGDLRHEPRMALTDGADGLQALRQIVFGARRWLRPGGSLMVEHGYDQANSVRAIFEAAGHVEIHSYPDLAGIERVTVGRLLD